MIMMVKNGEDVGVEVRRCKVVINQFWSLLSFVDDFLEYKLNCFIFHLLWLFDFLMPMNKLVLNCHRMNYMLP